METNKRDQSQYAATVSRVECEYQISWIEMNPESFKQDYGRFFKEHDGWNIFSRVTIGTLTLIAERIKKEGK